MLFGVGTDEGDYHAELGRLAAAGIPPAEVLLAATRNGAVALHREPSSARSKKASSRTSCSCVVRRGTNVADARNVVMVIQDGYVVVDRR